MNAAGPHARRSQDSCCVWDTAACTVCSSTVRRTEVAPRTRVLRRPILAQLVEKFRPFCGTRTFITAFKTAHHLSLSCSLSSCTLSKIQTPQCVKSVAVSQLLLYNCCAQPEMQRAVLWFASLHKKIVSEFFKRKTQHNQKLADIIKYIFQLHSKIKKLLTYFAPSRTRVPLLYGSPVVPHRQLSVHTGSSVRLANHSFVNISFPPMRATRQ